MPLSISKHEQLRSFLKGQSLPSNDWATIHKPLLSPFLFTRTGRHLNRFCVGSDPEFAFRERNAHVNAYSLGLRVGLAAGCDQNERIAELRPWPSVSVVEHITGIMSALRWMWRAYPHVQSYRWRAGAFFDQDGLGGHVHFGRKRPTREAEVIALDGLTRTLRCTGIFPLTEWDHRIRGDNHRQQYGNYSDIRPQRHGYEYRTMPSWLQSPSVAFLVVAASKLAILEPEVTAHWDEVGTEEARNRIRGLAKLYRGRDDDAYVLYHILTRNGDEVFNVIYDVDFAENWGFRRGVQDRMADAIILPSCIRPTTNEIQEMQEHLLSGTPLTFKREQPEFKTTLPNENYIWACNAIAAGRHPGFGDLIHNLVFHRNYIVSLEYTASDVFSICGFSERAITFQEIQVLKKYCPWARLNDAGGMNETYLTIPKSLCQTSTIAGLRAILLNTGIFPIWTVETVEEDSMSKWLASRKMPNKTLKWRTL